MKKSLYLILIFSVFLCSCKKYNFFADKHIIHHNELINDEYKFCLSIYYNDLNTYFDMPLEIGEIRDGQYEKKVDKILYERSFMQVFSRIFSKSPKIIKDKTLQETYLLNVRSICDVKNRNGDIIFWFSFNENEEEPYMILNGDLIEKNKMLVDYVRFLLYQEKPLEVK